MRIQGIIFFLGTLSWVGVFQGCALYEPVRVQIDPTAENKRVEVRQIWNLKTRRPDSFFEGSRPQEMGGLALYGDTLYLGNLEGKLMAVDRQHGRVIWTARYPGAIESRPLVVNKTIYFGCSDGYVYAASVHGGRLQWKTDFQTEVLGSMSHWEGRIYLQTADGRIAALDASTGKMIWEIKRPPVKDKSIRGVSQPVVHGQSLFVGTIDGAIAVYNALDGALIWEKRLTSGGRFSDVDTTPIVVDDRVVISAFDGKTYALSVKNGSVFWSYDAGAAFETSVIGTMVIVPTQNSSVDAVDLKTGDLKWRARFDQREGIATSIMHHDGFISFGTTDGANYLLSTKDGRFLWRFNPGSGVTSRPVFKDNRMYFFSNYGNIYAFAVRAVGRGTP